MEIIVEHQAANVLLSYICEAGAILFFVAVYVGSWFEGAPRRFWLASLTYEDKGNQELYRLWYVIAWVLAIVGSLILSFNDPTLPQTVWWILASTCWDIFLIVVLAKIIAGICILFWSVKKWICGQ